MNERKNRPQGSQGFRRQDRPQAQEPVEENEGQLEGRNAIQEALKSGRTIDKLFVASGDTDKGLQRLAAQAKEAGAVVVPVDRRKLDAMSFTRSHQGVIALCAAHDYYTIDDILAEYGYRRRDRYYEVDETKDVTLLFFARMRRSVRRRMPQQIRTLPSSRSMERLVSGPIRNGIRW